MTKRDFQSRFGVEAAALVQNATYLIALDVAREDCPYSSGGNAMEATSIIRNEGRMTGWNECLKFLKTIARSEPELPKVVETPLYADPDKRKSEQNRK
jgi:hypothetical protein